jgi:hypothetical protein
MPRTEYVPLGGLGASTSMMEPMLQHGPMREHGGLAHYMSAMFGRNVEERTGRLVDRSAPFEQSKGKMFIRRVIPTFLKHFNYSRDWFHSILNLQTHFIFLIIACAYLLSITLWAAWWWIIRDRCGMKFSSYKDAFFISLETISTIGYGVPDYYYDQCSDAFFVIFSEYMVGLVLDACCIGLIFSRIARPLLRARTVCLSGKVRSLY